MSGSVLLLGAPIDDLTMDETIDRLVEMVAEGRRTGRVHQVATVNVDFLVNAADDPELMAILQRTDLSMPDGMPLVWGSRLLGVPLRERVAGADLPRLLAARAAHDGLRLYFFGAAPGVADAAAALLRAEHPTLDVIADAGPRFTDPAEIDDEHLERIAAARPDIVFVALGNPKQERFIAAHGRRIGAPVLIGVGGSLDFVTGEQRRAPRWMQRTGTEWVWRALSDPRRLVRRYARDLAVFGPAFARQWWALRPRRGVAASACALAVEAGVVKFTLGASSSLTGAELDDAEAALAAGGSLTVDLAGCASLDERAASSLVETVRRARRHGAPVYVAGRPAPAESPLARAGVVLSA